MEGPIPTKGSGEGTVEGRPLEHDLFLQQLPPVHVFSSEEVTAVIECLDVKG